jgi:hypothetical protein
MIPFARLMKNVPISLMFLCIIVNYTFAKDQQIIITVTNPLDLNRSSEIVALQWNDLKRMSSTLDTRNILVLDVKTNNELITQVIDEEKNKTPKELIFRSNFVAKEIKQFIVRTFDRKPRIVTSLTDVRFMIPREDIAWENDRIAHRIYGPALAKEVNNGIDVWTKRVRSLIVEKWYKGDEATGTERISYHEDHGEGADFFDVGRSLGAGSCAIYKNDSLYQPGVFQTYKILATGPLRAMFEVTYKPVRFNGKNISEIKRITLDAGSNLNKIELLYQCDSLNDKVPFAAGIVKRTGTTSTTDSENRWVSLWGQTNEKKENGSLGTGIVMTKELFSGIKEDKIHVLILGSIEPNKTATYYAGAGWTRSGDFTSVEEWNNYLKEFSRRLNFPLEINLSNEK